MTAHYGGTSMFVPFRPEVRDIVGAAIYESPHLLVVAYGNKHAPDYDVIDKAVSPNTITHCWGWQAVAIRQKHAQWALRPEGQEPSPEEVDEFLNAVAWLGRQPLVVH